MPDNLGPIVIPDPPVISAFPIPVDWGGGLDYNVPIAIHVFDQPGLKTEQRFVLGPGAPRLRVRRDHLNFKEYEAVKAHWEQAQAQYASFPIAVAGPQGLETWNVRYENPDISFDHLAGMLTSEFGITFLVMPEPTPVWNSTNQVTRFPDSVFEAALAQETQHVYPLILIQPQARNPDGSLQNGPVYISNQRIQVDGNVYLPRLLTWSGISQTLGETSDSAQFTFGNADDVFTQWANQVNLYRAVVQFSLFHLDSGYLCYLWGGYALQWALDTSGRFVLPCSSGTFELTLGYPMRTITRTCWKVYKGRYCPSTSSFPTCDKSYQACIDRGVQTSFGGVVVPQQAVRVKDSTTGVLGWGRSWMTSVTVSNDTIYQNPLQEVWTDEAMPVVAPVAAGRDENDYYAALGIVSDGPIGKYNPDLVLQELDNQPPHDAFHNGGWRGILGNDPADPNSDFVGIDQAPWNTVPPGSTYSGGLAFVEIRRTDAAGLQVAPITDHSITANVLLGVGGWVWSAPGARVWQPGLSNCVWVAVNVYLRAMGLRLDPSRASAIPPSVMEQYFNVNQAIAMAAVCDLLVDKILPVTTPPTQENQFPFRGVLKERKPVKDWLTEILNCCLGYWTFVNGQLWIGIRYHAVPTDAFTQAHLKWKSLKIAPVKPAFNWLQVQFGDEEYDFQLNNVTLYDIDHASLIGTPESPTYLQSTMNLIGVSNLSQASRIIITRLREETGGLVLRDSSGNVTTDEQLVARNFSFTTTILALKNMVGDVISLTHPKMPGGSGKGRIISWNLNPDFSIDIQAECVTDSMYQYDTGPLPQSVNPPPVPPERTGSPIGLVWMPDYLAAFEGDPLYPDPAERTFALWQDYNIAKDGSWAPALYIAGYLNVNTFVSIDKPAIASISPAGGGNLAGGQTVYAAVTVRDASGRPATPSKVSAVFLQTGTSSQSVALTILPPPAGTTWAGWDIWAGTDRRAIAWQDGGTGAIPASYTLTGPLHRYTEALPDGAAKWVQIGVKHVIHSGIAGLLVTTVPDNNQIQCNEFIGSSDNWVGRIVSAIGDATDGVAPLWNFTVTGFDSTTGTLTVSPDCVHPGDSTNTVKANDVLIVRSIVDSISSDGLTVTDSMWNNSVGKSQFGGDDPSWAGLAPGAEIGNVYRIIRGAGMGQFATILANDYLSVTLATPLVGVDATSIGIVEEHAWADTGQSSPVLVPAAGQSVQVRIPVDNLANVVGLVGGFLNDGNGHITDESLAVYREIFIFGQPPSVRTAGPDPGPWQVEATDQTVNVDTGANDVTLDLPDLASYEGRTLLIFNLGANRVLIDALVGQTFFDGNTEIILENQGDSVRITSAGNYTTPAMKRAIRR
ncbi:MAG TPA: hypothetical protein VGF16_16530 [Bryobacteraceae bacterium]